MLRHRTVRWATALAAAGMMLAASASASPTWLSKVPLPLDSGHSAHGVQVGMDARGDALTLFNITQTGVTNAQTVETDDRFAGRVFGNFTDMSSGPIEADTVGSFDGRLAVDGAGDAAATWTYQSDPGTNPDAHTIRLRRRPAGGDWGSPVDASAPGAPAGEDARFPSIAVDGHGTPTVAWQDTSSGGPVRAVTEPAIGGPRMPQLLTGTGEAGSDPSVAANARGDRAVAWRLLNGTGDQAIALNTAAFGTAAFGAHKTLANSSGTNVVTPPAAALTATGTATVVWAEGATTGAISAADVPLGGNPSPTSTVSAMDQAQTTKPPAFAMNARGDAVAIWATSNAIRAALRPAGQSWGQPQTVWLGPGNFTLAAISAAMDPSGDVLAAWSVDIQGNTVHVASHRVGGNWNHAAVSSDATNPVPRVAMDAAGDGIVAWSPPADGANPTHSVETIGFDGAGPQLNGLVIASSAVAGAPAAFSVSPFDVWSPVASTAWSFGDGAGAGGTSVQHAYGAPGSYTVTLTSADALGNTTSTSGVVNVSPAAPPLAVTGAVQRLGQTTAKISATLNAHGLGTSFHFQWGKSRAYGSVAPKPDAGLGSGTVNRVVTTTLRRLRPHTTYHYRVVASYCKGCSYGTTVGTDGTFTTLSFAQLPGSVDWQWALGQDTTSFPSLVAHLPRGAGRIIVSCAARGCPAKRWTVGTTVTKRSCHQGRCARDIRPLTDVDLTPGLRGRRLEAGGHLTIEVLKSRYTGIEFQFTLRRQQPPAFSKECLVNGGRRAIVC